MKNIDKKTAEEFAYKSLNQSIEDVRSVDTGEHAQSFFVYTNKKSYVIKFNDEKESFEKDRYAYENFYRDNIPIAKTIDIGQGPESLYHAILEKCNGGHPGHGKKPINGQVVEKMMTLLVKIHEVDIQDTNGYGGWGSDNGNAEHESWSQYLLDFADFVRSEEFLFDIESKQLIQDVLNSYEQLIKHCPEDRRLVHADCGFDNVLFEDSEITCVIDWGNSIYGDFVFDIAWLEYWHDKYNYKNIYKNKIKNRNYKRLAKRIRCYKLKIALSSLHFFGKNNKEKSYRKFKQKRRKLL